MKRTAAPASKRELSHGRWMEQDNQRWKSKHIVEIKIKSHLLAQYFHYCTKLPFAMRSEEEKATKNKNHSHKNESQPRS